MFNNIDSVHCSGTKDTSKLTPFIENNNIIQVSLTKKKK
jgi:hypothetical protein